jgi:hypothetical protein
VLPDTSVAVTVLEADEPWFTVRPPELASIKPKGALTFKLTDVVLLTLPAVPFTVSE